NDLPLRRARVLRLVDQHVVDAAVELVVHPARVDGGEELQRLADQVGVVEQAAAFLLDPIALDHGSPDDEQRGGAVTADHRVAPRPPPIATMATRCLRAAPGRDCRASPSGRRRARARARRSPWRRRRRAPPSASPRRAAPSARAPRRGTWCPPPTLSRWRARRRGACRAAWRRRAAPPWWRGRAVRSWRARRAL